MVIGINARLLLSNRIEGVARYAWETTKAMILAHPDDQFVLFFDRAYDPQFVIADNVRPVVLFPPTRHPILWKIWFDYILPKAVKRHKIDVFYSPDGFCSFKLKIPTVLVSHDLAYHHYPETMRNDQIAYYQKNVPRFHQHADHIVAVSNSTKQDIISVLSISAAKITVAFNALAGERSHEILDISARKPYILYLGSIHPRKNIKRLLEAFEQYKNQHPQDHIQLKIAGRKAFQNEDVDSYYAQMKHRDAVHFLGQVDEATKHELYAQASLFVYVSLFEGFGIPLLEAMQYGTPIVCSKGGALEEVGGDAVILVDPYQADAICEGLKKGLSNLEKVQVLRQRGFRRIQDFSWKTSAQTIYDIIQEQLHQQKQQ